MGRFKRLQIMLVPTNQIRRHRQQLKILGCQRSCLIGERKL
jgi:hypothetical protein